MREILFNTVTDSFSLIYLRNFLKRVVIVCRLRNGGTIEIGKIKNNRRLDNCFSLKPFQFSEALNVYPVSETEVSLFCLTLSWLRLKGEAA